MRKLRGVSPRVAIVVLSAWVTVGGATLRAEEPQPPAYLADRGEGILTSLIGASVEKREFIIYPFHEYTKATAFEYKPSELGFAGDSDFLGKTVEPEALVYVGYGFTDRLSVELEMALHAKTSFDKAPDDPSAVPAKLEESGFGDLDMQLRWRWAAETAGRPEMYSFFEVTPPLQKNRLLIGTQDWEASLGFGVVPGFRRGTITRRAAIAWDGADSKIDLGEYAFEYLKRISRRWRARPTRFR